MNPFRISGHTVEYHEHSSLWLWRDDEGKTIFSADQLSPVRAAIEKHEAKLAKQSKEKFVEWEAVLYDWKGLSRVTVISQVDDNHVWTRHLDQRRSKERLSSLKPLAECAELWEKYAEAQAQIDQGAKRREEIVLSLFPKV